jgi:hypothetical protein
VVCALQTHQPALAEAVGDFRGTEEAEVPMLRFKVGDCTARCYTHDTCPGLEPDLITSQLTPNPSTAC